MKIIAAVITLLSVLQARQLTINVNMTQVQNMGRYWGNTTQSLQQYLEKTDRDMKREMMPYAQKIAYYMKKMARTGERYNRNVSRTVDDSVKHAWKQTLQEIGCNQTGSVDLPVRMYYYKSRQYDSATKKYKTVQKSYPVSSSIGCYDAGEFVNNPGKFLYYCQCTRLPVKTSVSNAIDSSTSLHHNGTHNSTNCYLNGSGEQICNNQTNGSNSTNGSNGTNSSMNYLNFRRSNGLMLHHNGTHNGTNGTNGSNGTNSTVLFASFKSRVAKKMFKQVALELKRPTVVCSQGMKCAIV